MKKYRVSGAYSSFTSGVLQLTEEQYRSREHALTPLGDGLYRVITPVGFKRGEVVGFEGEADKALLQEILSIPDDAPGTQGNKGKGKGRKSMAQSFRGLKDIHKGRPAVILGAAPSLPGQIGLIPEGAVVFAVNERPSKLVTCDYIVFCDDNTVGMVEGLEGKKISPFKSSDYRIDKEVWFGGSSSTSAAFIALYAGCAPVILMGMDLYQGEREYFDDPQGHGFHSSASFSSLERHLKMWEEAFSRCPNPSAIKAAGGPLVEIFGKYEAVA